MTFKKITIALISNSAEEFKRFSVPRYLLVLTLIFIISGAAYLGWIITNYHIVKSKMPLLIQLQKENEQQRIAFARLANRIKSMTPKANQTEKYGPNVDGSVKLEPVGNGQNAQISGSNPSEPELIPSNYAVGGSELPEENMVPYPYSLQIGSYRTLKRADKAILIYRRKGLSPYWVKVDLGENGIWFRVFVGYFRDIEKATNFRQANKITGALIKKIAYANLIGIYSVEEQFEGEILLLEKNGYFPYVIKDEKEKLRLFVGAFFTRAGVEKQYYKLRAQGIQSEIVKR